MTSTFLIYSAISKFSENNLVLKNKLKMFYKNFLKIGGVIYSNEDEDLPIVYFVTSGGTENTILSYWKRMKKTEEPVIIIAHDSDNSLPAAMEILAKLNQEGQSGKVIYFASPEDERSMKKLEIAIKDIITYRKLKHFRIGAIGEPSEWLIASNQRQEYVRRTWGIDVVSIKIESLMREIEACVISPNEEKNHFVENAKSVIEPNSEDFIASEKVYESLKKIIKETKVDAVTLRCFDLVAKLKTTGCMALAKLTDEGIIAGCEGDVPSIVAMTWVNKLLNETPWMSNPSRVDEEENTLWLAHCTVPITMVKEYNIRSHFESGLGVAVEGYIESSPVTLIRIGGKQLDKIWVAEGDIINQGTDCNLCRTQAEIKLRTGSVSDLLNSPLGNHIILVKGKHKKRLDNWVSTFIK